MVNDVISGILFKQLLVNGGKNNAFWRKFAILYLSVYEYMM